MKYRKKAVVIEAVQWTGKNAFEILDFIDSQVLMEEGNDFFHINTLEGNMRADKNDWIIKGVQGEFYPCKPDIFEMTYDKVD